MEPDGLRLSPQQQRIWSRLDQDQGQGSRIVALLRVEGRLDEERWQTAWRELIAKYEILRTTLRGGVQIVHDDATAHETIEDLRDQPAAARQERLEQCWDAALQASRPPLDTPSILLQRLLTSDTRQLLILTLPAWSADRVSIHQLATDLARIDAALSRGEPVDQEAMQYADVAEWQLELQDAEDSLPGRKYWQSLELPPATPLPQEKPATGRRVLRTVHRQVPAAALHAVSSQLGTSERTVCLAAWSALAYRLTRTPRLLMGVASAGRSYEELEDVVGPLARALPGSITIAPTASAAQLAAEWDRRLATVEQWQECYPAGALVDRGPEPLPLAFDFAADSGAVAGAPLRLHVDRVAGDAEPFQCQLSVTLRDERADLQLAFDADRLTITEAERLADQLVTVLDAMLAGPATRIEDLPVLGAAEAQRLLIDFNRTDAAYDRTRCMHELIAAQPPGDVAVEMGERRLTYGELEERANQLAHHLQQLGVVADQLVGLSVERSVEMVIGIVGILKAGGAYVPIDPAYPRDRLAFLLEDTQATVLVTQQKMQERLPPHSAQPVCLDSDWPAIARQPTTPPPPRARPANLVYVIYTSGSTGKPKGVVITHDKLMISNTARVNYFGEVPRKFLLLSSFSFDSSVVGLFWTLCGGGTLLLVPEDQQQDLTQLPALMADRKVSHFLTLPSFYSLILEHAQPGQMDSLTTVIVAGEACPLKMVERHRQQLPDTRLFSEYGATETTVFASVYDCLPQTLTIAPVGGPIENAQMYVLDEHLQPVATGLPGEVHFGGDALAVGYHRRPDLTAERFVPNPFARQPGERLYKSGDLARHREDGDVEFLGRLDNQVKIRGYRIELEEIEVVLLRHPAVEETAVLALTDISAEKRLVGYVVLKGDDPPTPGDLREYLKELVPEYMVPAVFVVLDDMPRTPNGKVDRKNLPEPGAERPELAGDYEAPTSPAEATLCAVWAAALGLERVGIRDNFFELGGDSILSIQIISRAKEQGLKLTPRQVFVHQTVAELAAVAEVVEGTATGAEQGVVTGAVPLTPVQRWFFELELPEPQHWNMPILLELGRPLAAADLQRALDELTRHHDALRLRFSAAQAGWRQEILPPPVAVPITTFDLADVPTAEQEIALLREATERQGKLDLTSGPLLTATLFPRGESQPGWLLLVAHHLVVDGVSWRILVEDLEALLPSTGKSSPLPAKTTSWKEWSDRLLESTRSDDGLRQLQQEAGYWLDAAPAAAPPLPLDHPGGDNLEASVAQVKATLDQAATRTLLQEVPRAYNTQINDVLLTAFVEAVSSWAGQDSLWLTLEGHGREDLFEDVDLSRTVGWFTADYPVRLDATRPYEPGTALRSIKAQLRRVPRQGMAFGLLRYLGDDDVARQLRALPVPSLGFNYLGQFHANTDRDSLFQLSSAGYGPTQSPAGQRVFQLEAYGAISAGRLELQFEYSKSRHEAATIQVLADAFVATLQDLIQHCTGRTTRTFEATDFAAFGWQEEDLEAIAGAIRRAREQHAGVTS